MVGYWWRVCGSRCGCETRTHADAAAELQATPTAAAAIANGTDQHISTAPTKKCARGHMAPVEWFTGVCGGLTKICRKHREADARYQKKLRARRKAAAAAAAAATAAAMATAAAAAIAAAAMVTATDDPAAVVVSDNCSQMTECVVVTAM